MPVPQLPRFNGPVPEREFAEATGLDDRQIDRFEAEGLLQVRFERDPWNHWVDNAAEFVERVMAPSLGQWPPPMAELDTGLEREYAATGGDPEIAARILEPFRFNVLAPVWEAIVALARPSVRLLSGGKAGIGRSRIGGEPDLPAGLRWPCSPDGAPLGFVAQIALSDIQRALPNTSFPARGLLSFFSDPMQDVWGFDPADRGRWAVLQLAGALRPTPPPADLPEDGRYTALPVEPRGELTVPEIGSVQIERLELDDLQDKAYYTLNTELLDAHVKNHDRIHRFLGWPDQVQHDLPSDVQLPANGINAGREGAYGTDEAKRLQAARDVWGLLLQIDSDDDTGMSWGDNGRIYYMIRRDDLATRDWASCWFSLQCH